MFPTERHPAARACVYVCVRVCVCVCAGAEEATQNLQLLQRACPDSPRSLSFSFGRALQDAVLKAWAGDPANTETAQELLLELARVNSEAQLGVWNEEHPASGGDKIGLPKLSYASERAEGNEALNLFNW